MSGSLEGGRSPERLIELYREHAPSSFARLPEGLGLEELEGLILLHRDRLEAEREERKMHFGAFALAGVLLFLLIPSLVASGGRSIPLRILVVLLCALLVPYAFVYYGYEKRVRGMSEGLFRLRERYVVRLAARRGTLPEGASV